MTGNLPQKSLPGRNRWPSMTDLSTPDSHYQPLLSVAGEQFSIREWFSREIARHTDVRYNWVGLPPFQESAGIFGVRWSSWQCVFYRGPLAGYLETSLELAGWPNRLTHRTLDEGYKLGKGESQENEISIVQHRFLFNFLLARQRLKALREKEQSHCLLFSFKLKGKHILTLSVWWWCPVWTIDTLSET